MFWWKRIPARGMAARRRLEFVATAHLLAAFWQLIATLRRQAGILDGNSG
jgi:hypothetical protein